jgi:hypothetical protein
VLHHEEDLISGTAILLVNAVIMLEMDQFASATAPTSFVELMEMYHSVSGKLQCHKQHHEHNVAISDLHTGNHHITYAYWHS